MSDIESLRGGGDGASHRRSPSLFKAAGLGVLAPVIAAFAFGALAPAAAQAATTGTINGSFTVPSGTHDPQDINVLLVDRNGNAIAPTGATITDTSSTAATYVINNVNPGQYYVYFSDSTTGDNVAPDYYGDGGVDNISKGTVVTVPATGGAQALATETLAAGATISGTVTDANSASETSSHVVAEPVNATSDPDPQLNDVPATVTGGTYTITGLPANSYTIRYRAAGTAFNLADIYADGTGVTYDYGSATQYVVGAGSSTTASFSVPAVGGISGTVADSTGGALFGVNVEIYDAAGTVIPVSPTTAVDGTYTASDVLPGSYQVEFEGLAASNLASSFYGGSTLATATKVTVASGVTLQSINGVLSAAATIGGTVTAAQGGAEIGGLQVELLDSQGNVVTSAFTNANGTYTLTGVPAGTWYLEFVGGRAYNGQYYATEYYLGKGTLGGATAVKVTAGQSLAGINESLLTESTTLPGLPKVSRGSLSGLSSDKVALKFKLAAGSGPAGYLRSFSIKLPKNVSWNKAALKKDIVIAHDAYTYAIKSGRLVITFATGKKTVSFQIKAGGIKVSKGIETRAKARKIKSEAIDVSATDTTGKATSLSFTVKNPH
ncbi:MAG TPA: carboxypeptidase regulatory-like domain-containing protein [Solirubrobacteraceae bacterium]|jgi:hypothetical protein|nr:carboxypeptidase regulatory-like domain-containing protein [Solirubrobacteraceae bacterium]